VTTDHDHGTTPFATLCLINFASCLLLFPDSQINEFFGTKSTVHIPLAINECDQLVSLELRESSLLLTLSFPTCELAKCRSQLHMSYLNGRLGLLCLLSLRVFSPRLFSKGFFFEMHGSLPRTFWIQWSKITS
jgi:hypothetical protein